MKAELKKKWVAALRSGAYEQTHKMLCRVDGAVIRYCCLGVLAAIQGVTEPASDQGLLVDDCEELSGGLTRNSQDRFAALNDSGMAFPAIAVVIEAEVPEEP